MDDGEREFLEAALPHLDAIYRVARHTARDPGRAEDFVQETYLRAFAAFAAHRPTNVRGWLVAICLNLVRSDARRRARRPAEELVAEVDAAALESEGERSPADQALARIDREIVARALAELPEDQRVAVVLMDLLGYSAAEVGELLGHPRNTVLSWVHRGHRRLALQLAAQGVDRELF